MDVRVVFFVQTRSSSIPAASIIDNEYNMMRCAWFLLFLILTLTWPLTVSVQAAETLAIMHPDPATILQWQEKTRTAPRAFIDSQLQAELLQGLGDQLGDSISLLDRFTYLPTERYQGDCGNCWNWAAQGVASIALQVQEGIRDRLSVQFLDSCKLDKYACCGGWLDDFAEWYTQKGMFVPWSNAGAEYADSQSVCSDGASSYQCLAIDTSSHYSIDSVTVETIPTRGIDQAVAIANIKNVLNQNKAIWFGFFLPDQESWDAFFSFWNNEDESAVYTLDGSCGARYDSSGGGHAVLLVGYNDEGSEPYWEIVNSWGTAGNRRPNGTFRVRMDMDYDCTYAAEGFTLDAFSFQTLQIDFSASKPQCSYAISPPSAIVPSAGGRGSIDVITSPDCTWTATTADSWISIIPPQSAIGNGAVTYRVALNTSIQRTGIVRIGNREFTISQLAAENSSQLLKNGGFELGNNGDWQEEPVNGVIYAHPCYGASGIQCAQEGEFVARLGGDNNSDTVLEQNIVVPDEFGALRLRFWYAVSSTEPHPRPYDYLTVTVTRLLDNFSKTLIVLDNTKTTDNWVESEEFDLSDFIGSAIRLQFAGVTDATFPTSFYIDNVRLTGIPGESLIPPAPEAINASDGTFADHIAITWSEPKGASYYQLYRCLSEAVNSCSLIKILAKTFYDDVPGSADTVYYRVQACNSVGCSPYSGSDSGFLAQQGGTGQKSFPWSLYLHLYKVQPMPAEK